MPYLQLCLSHLPIVLWNTKCTDACVFLSDGLCGISKTTRAKAGQRTCVSFPSLTQWKTFGRKFSLLILYCEYNCVSFFIKGISGGFQKNGILIKIIFYFIHMETIRDFV